MSESGGLAEPGRESFDLQQDIIEEIESAGIPLTAKMLTERLDGPARRTVYNYVSEMENEGQLHPIEYGNAKAYWLDAGPATTSAGQHGVLGTLVWGSLNLALITILFYAFGVAAYSKAVEAGAITLLVAGIMGVGYWLLTRPRNGTATDSPVELMAG